MRVRHSDVTKLMHGCVSERQLTAQASQTGSWQRVGRQAQATGIGMQAPSSVHLETELRPHAEPAAPFSFSKPNHLRNASCPENPSEAATSAAPKN